MSSTRGHRLAAAMKARRVLKLSVLAAALGVSESAVSRWRHDGAMTLENVEAVCSYLDISADWLLFGRGPMDATAAPASERDDECLQTIARLPPDARTSLWHFLRALGV